jgi:Abnormal spindle-like microcephaly-assoc'd, ASPM-SPD-2-Hydin
VNNSFSNNKSNSGNSAVYTNSTPGLPTLFYNNIIVALAGQIALDCGNFNTTTLPMLTSNDVYAPGGTNYGEACTDQTGMNGNISADPLFVSSSNYRLKGGSPAIDAGDNSAPDLPSKDFAGNPRIINGNDAPTAIIDMGAYEFVPVTLTPKYLNFGTQAVGSTTTKTVTLTNAQERSLSISSKTVPTGYKVSGCGSTVAVLSSCSLTVTFHPLTTGVLKGNLTVKDNAGNSPQTVTLSGRGQ